MTSPTSPTPPTSPNGTDPDAAPEGADDPRRANSGYTNLGYARLDTARLERTGDPEVVYGEGKSPEQVVGLVDALRQAHPETPALVTRLTDEGMAAVRSAYPHGTFDALARSAAIGPTPAPRGLVNVIAAGTSDGWVAAEAAFTAATSGAGVRRIDDVGVAGIHRLLDVKDELDHADCLIVVAGMEGALPSVVGGLTGVPLVAVPTSIGYGASFGGMAALLAMLNSCAPGIVVCNIDNGFGAGVFASRVARRAAPGEVDAEAAAAAEQSRKRPT